MAFLYINDSTPFAEEYENNYIYFDANDPKAVREALQIFKKRVMAINKNAPNLKNSNRGLHNCNSSISNLAT